MDRINGGANSNCKKVGVSILKKMFVVITILMIYALNTPPVYAKPQEQREIKPFAEEWYVTTEDIIWDIIFPFIDKVVIKEYGGREDSGFGWKKERIVNIVYNNNHSYDISIRIQVPVKSQNPLTYREDLVRVRISPSCDSPKISCSHGFSVDVLEYKQLSH